MTTERRRETLRQYFVRNAIPTEGQFADLIDGGVNLQDDGLARLPEGPLVIASSAAGGPTTALRTYGESLDSSPGLLVVDSGTEQGLHVKTDGIAARQGSGSAALQLQPDGGELLVHGLGEESSGLLVTEDGRLGLGTRSPAGRLDVHGDLMVDGGKPLIFERFIFERSDAQIPGRLHDRNATGYSSTEYAAALIGQVQTDVPFQQAETPHAYLTEDNDQWYVDLLHTNSPPPPQKWFMIDVLFVSIRLAQRSVPWTGRPRAQGLF